MIEIKCDTKGEGNVFLADDVIAVIAGTAALEVDGVTSTGAYLKNDLVGKIGKKNFAKGVRVSFDEESVCIDLVLSVKFGFRIQDISLEVQKKVKTAIETMTGLNVSKVNVNVAVVNFDKIKNQSIAE